MNVVAYDTLPKVLKAIDLVSVGRTLSSACREVDLGVITFKRYVEDDNHKELMVAYEEALQLGFDALSETLLEIDRDPHYGHSDAKMASVISKNIQWFLTKRNPKKFGERLNVEVNVSADRVIIEHLQAAKNRALGHGTVIDVTPLAVEILDAETAFLRAIGAG